MGFMSDLECGMFRAQVWRMISFCGSHTKGCICDGNWRIYQSLSVADCLSLGGNPFARNGRLWQQVGRRPNLVKTGQYTKA